MEVEILFHSIANILHLRNSLVNRLSVVDINQLINNLNEIDETVKNAQKSRFHGSEDIRTWLKNVKEAIIEFNDLIEDINLKESINKNLSIFRWVLSLKSRYSVTRQVTKTQGHLKSLSEDGKRLISKEGEKEEEEEEEEEQAAAGSRRFSNEMFEKVTVVGREYKKKEIIDKLLKWIKSTDAFHVGVFVIVGVSGIGKTKLARLVCEDEQVNANFGLQPIWIDLLHETFDVESIVKSATTTVDDGKHRLIVLDDLRNEIKNDLEKLQQRLKESCGTGCVILITTRDNHVANNISGFAARFDLEGFNEKEKKEIIDQLLKLNNSTDDFHVGVFVIVGVPGIGKTKLARLVCEDEQVKANFGLQQIWIDLLHETFDVESIVKSATTIVDEGKHPLIVLDDLRNEIKNDLEKLQQRLKESCGTGCAILITTRSNHVANNISGSAARFDLKGFNEKDSQSLFQQIRRSASASTSTSTNNKQDEELEIVKDCSGVPLAIIIKAVLMNKILDEERGIIEDVEREFLKELKFRYYEDLPTQYKLCFSFCSLFPENYLIDAERLIQLWFAEGFITFSSISQQENGFNEFVASVFQQVEKENSEDQHGVVRERYQMNRFMHKLTRLVASGENITVDSKGEKVEEGMLRASFDFGLDLSCGIPDSMFKAKKLRTILLPYKNINNPRLPHEVKMTTSTCDKIFNAFKYSLRVLDLNDLGIKIVPTSIEEMKYLRFLDLSHNNIEKLPSCITKLIHLQTLKLSYCHVLKELPKDLKDLTRLSHLNIEGCLDLTHMPTGIGKLTSLQTLSLFVASKKHADTGGLRELTDLNNLEGKLEILHLEQVKFSPSNEAAKDEFVKNKQHLQHLTLRWDCDDDEEGRSGSGGADVDNNDEKLLECLQPPPNLKVLFVVGYNGLTLSKWLDSLQCLVKFTLSDCPKCKFLPPMDHLPNLKALHLRRLESLEFISEKSSKPKVDSSSSKQEFFPALKELTISDCPKLESWWENDKILEENRPSFPCISKLNIRCCPKLACMPLCTNLDEELILVDSNVRSMRETKTETEITAEASLSPLLKLKFMVIERIEESPPQNWLEGFTSLKELHIRDCPNLKSLPQGFKTLSSLQSLSIERCQEFHLEKPEVDYWEGLINLESLTLRSIPKLVTLTRGFGNLKSLKDLRIYDCPSLTHLPETIDNLTSLRELVLSECRSMDSLPKGMINLRSLFTLNIMDCPLLLPRCQPETGDDWPQIAQIKHKSVKETPQDLGDL